MKSKPKYTLTIIAALLFVIASIVAGYFYYELSSLKRTDSDKAKEEELDIISKVGKHILLPQDETPTIATVTDPNKLTDQPFFAHAKSGDKVLVYTKAKKAYLYNPSADVIVEVAPLNLGSTSTK